MLTTVKSTEAKSAIRVRTLHDETMHTLVTDIRIKPDVEVGTIDGNLCFWVAGRMIRIGPFSVEQAEKLSEDLGYEAVQ